MKFMIEICFGVDPPIRLSYENEGERNVAFQTIYTADWGKPFLIRGESNGHKYDMIINLPQVRMLSCANER